MKNALFLSFLFLTISPLASQTIEPAPEDKAVIYFMRPSVTGTIINFVLFHENKVIGRLGGAKYFRYECEPGEHAFWAKSENRSFLKADVKAGHIYIIHVQPMMGLTRASVQLGAIDPKIDKLKKFQKLLAKYSSWDLDQGKKDDLNKQLDDYAIKGLERFDELEAVGKLSDYLEPDMFVEAKDLKFVKKEKKKKNKR